MEVRIKKSVFKEIARLPRKIQVLYFLFLEDLRKEGLGLKGWELKKLSGFESDYRVKLNRDYRVIIEFIKPDLIIVKVTSREGAYR